MESIIEDVEGTRVYTDDLIVWGKTRLQHHERLDKLLQRVKKQWIESEQGKIPV